MKYNKKPSFKEGDVVILNCHCSISSHEGIIDKCMPGDIAVIEKIYIKAERGDIFYCCKFYVPIRNSRVDTEGCPAIKRKLTKKEIGYWLWGN